MSNLLIESLTNELTKTLPGESAHKLMQVNPRSIFNQNIKLKNLKMASVLICLYPNEGSWYFFLTKRTNLVYHHKGQISLPGGMIEIDEDAKLASLRETHEEIGINPKLIKIIGRLTSINVPISNFKIIPFIGWMGKKPKTIIQKEEVAKVFSVSITDLVDDDFQKKENRKIEENIVTVPYFYFKYEKVWGATSIILSELKIILKRIL
jgi:8-oxo-dGTP pyrophosphatase MutT (NUDIX family)